MQLKDTNIDGTLTINNLDVADYIVEQGTVTNPASADGYYSAFDWTYRKWKSGILEIWGCTQVVFPIGTEPENTGITNAYMSYVDFQLPEEISFNGNICATVSLDWNYTEWPIAHGTNNLVRVRVLSSYNSLYRQPSKRVYVRCIGKQTS